MKVLSSQVGWKSELLMKMFLVFPVIWKCESDDLDQNLSTLLINVLAREPKQQELGGLHGYRALQNMQKNARWNFWQKYTQPLSDKTST